MNLVFISPHFPPNFYHFVVRLKERGINVLGLGDSDYWGFRDELKDSLTEYYKVSNLKNYEEVLKAIGYFTYKYGKIDRIESHTEYWLETDAKLRTDFNVYGIKEDFINHIKKKSAMKKLFQEAGVSAPRWVLEPDYNTAVEFVKNVNYPVVAKPDVGVGAWKTYMISNDEDLQYYFSTKPDVSYIMEEMIKDKIYTFDGLTDRDGDPVFYTSHIYSNGIMDVVNNDLDVYYYSLRDIPKELEKSGIATLKAFKVKERFFHFEFFYNESTKRVTALEVNMRPPGGFTMDMFNYANDIDLYAQWANLIKDNNFTSSYNRKYHCLFAGRKWNKNYKFSFDEIRYRFNNYIVAEFPMPDVYSTVMGNYGLIFRHTDLKTILEIGNYVLEKE